MPPDVMTIHEAARRLERNPHYVRGLVEGLGIRVQAAGRMRLLTLKDFKRLEKVVSPPSILEQHAHAETTV